MKALITLELLYYFLLGFFIYLGFILLFYLVIFRIFSALKILFLIFYKNSFFFFFLIDLGFKKDIKFKKRKGE